MAAGSKYDTLTTRYIIYVYIYIYIFVLTRLQSQIRAAARWDFQVVIRKLNQNGKAACYYYSLKNSKETPCTWQTPLVELANGDKHTGPKW